MSELKDNIVLNVSFMKIGTLITGCAYCKEPVYDSGGIVPQLNGDANRLVCSECLELRAPELAQTMRGLWNLRKYRDISQSFSKN